MSEYIFRYISIISTVLRLLATHSYVPFDIAAGTVVSHLNWPFGQCCFGGKNTHSSYSFFYEGTSKRLFTHFKRLFTRFLPCSYPWPLYAVAAQQLVAKFPELKDGSESKCVSVHCLRKIVNWSSEQ